MSVYNQIPAAHSVPDDLNVVIEIPAQHSSIKYELDKETGLLAVDRFMPTAMYYPCNYGFIPSTLAEDGDPADVLVITPFPVQPGCLVRARALGVLRMEDEAGQDSKILAVPTAKTCIEYAHIKSMTEVSPILLESIVHFFENYKGLEKNKWVKVVGWEGVDSAAKEIQDSINRFKKV